MDKNRSIYAIYKYDFHKATEPLIQTRADGIDGAKYLKQAQKCFESLFDQNTIDGLCKISHGGDASRLPNDVLQKVGDIIMWRVNNSQMKDVWTRRGKDCNGIDRYEPDKVESNPYCNVLIDNRPGKCLMAIEKSAAWSSKPDGLRDILLENFNLLLANRFDLEMRIEARMNPKDIWDFVHECIYEHGDFVKEVKFTFQNRKKVNRTDAMEVKSSRLRAMLRTAEIADALKAYFVMEFDQYTNGKISPKNKDLAEMVNLCANNGYDISIRFNNYKLYRINDYVRAYYPMMEEDLNGFQTGTRLLDERTTLERWFDEVDEQTKGYVNESEVPRRRNR